MQDILIFLAKIPGLGLFLILSGALMIGLDLKKLASYVTAEARPKDFRFSFILPGLAFFAFGFMVIRAVAQ